MHVLTIVPLSRVPGRDTLTYYTSKVLTPGALVSVPIRRSTIPGVVVESYELPRAKEAVKASSFELKPIKGVLQDLFITSGHIEAYRKIADFFAASLGNVIHELFPASILSARGRLSVKKDITQRVCTGGEKDNVSMPIVVQTPLGERIQNYRAIIRSSFAKKKSVLFVVPTISDMKNIEPYIIKGIEQYACLLNSELTKKNQIAAWNSALASDHPVLILTTRAFISIPRHDLQTIIIEHESSPYYRSQKRPYIDARIALEILAREMGYDIVVGDTIVRTSTYWRQESQRGLSQSAPPARILSNADQLVVELAVSDPKRWQKKNKEPVVSDELLRLIDYAREENDRTLVFINRRGHSTTITCNDCKKTLLCQTCNAPLILHTKNAERLVCHTCLSERKVPTRCIYCSSWNIQHFGIGIDKVEREISAFIPPEKFFRIDSDTIRNDKKGAEIIEKFFSTSGSVLICTELVFSYLKAGMPVDHVAIASVDSLLSIPNFRINEKVFRMLLELRIIAEKTFMIQTHRAKTRLFEYATRGNISGFYRDELEHRKKLNYPPFSLLIRISKAGRNRSSVEESAASLTEELKKWQPVLYPAVKNSPGGLSVWHILLRLNPLNWPYKEQHLATLIRTLTPDWHVEINPESLL